jgi:2-methylcitrate dehydratase PrpD
MLIASTIASAALGSGIASAMIIRALAREHGGTPEASIWFDPGPKLSVAEAARVNAVMSDAAASDDSDLRNIVHTGTTLVSTSLALAERTGASGQEVLAAIVLGYEAAGRIGEAITPNFRQRGFHGCIVAIFGGAVATGRLLGLDAAHMAQAIALSATSMGGLYAFTGGRQSREPASCALLLRGLCRYAPQKQTPLSRPRPAGPAALLFSRPPPPRVALPRGPIGLGDNPARRASLPAELAPAFGPPPATD